MSSSPTVVLRGSPVNTNTLKHPSTGTTVDEALKKRDVSNAPDTTTKSPLIQRGSPVASTSTSFISSPISVPVVSVKQPNKVYIDPRSPDVSPKVTLIPRLKYDDITSPINHSPKAGPGLLTPKKSVKNVHSSPGPGLNYKKSSPVQSPVIYDYDDDNCPIIVVKKNDDGTYSPIKDIHNDQLEEDDNVPKRTEPDIYSKMTKSERQAATYAMCHEIKSICGRYPKMGFDEMPDDGSVPPQEINTYLTFMRNTIAQEEKLSLLDMGISGIYSLASLLMEYFFKIPMKSYFEGLKGRVSDYRTLIMENTDISQFVTTYLPSISAPKTSITTILVVFFGQILIGCGAAAAGWYFGGNIVHKVGVSVGAAGVNAQLDSFMFKGQNMWETIGNVTKTVFAASKMNEPAAGGVPKAPIDV